MRSSNAMGSAAVLARVLSKENLSVDYSAKVSTAYFDLKTRSIVLPLLKDMDDSILLNGLVCHEIGHALLTPGERYIAETRRLDPNNVGYVNIICDARIEKLLKREYSGLRTIMAVFYRRLWDELFRAGYEKAMAAHGVASLDDLPFIDRINLHFKFGHVFPIAFHSDAELSIIDRVEDAETFDDVVSIVEDIIKLEPPKEEPEKSGTETKTQADEGTSSDSTENDGIQRSHGGMGGSSITSVIYEDAMKAIVAAPSKIDPMQLVVPPSSTIDSCSQSIFEFLKNKTAKAPFLFPPSDLVKGIRPYVDSMVQRFEQRKNARALAKVRIDNTGSLDPNKLHSYRYNDDIFIRNEIAPAQKSHGIIMLIDWSTSMRNVAYNMIQQAIVVSSFARKVGIPFEVYLFTHSFAPSKKLNFKINQIEAFGFGLVKVLSDDMSGKDFKLATSILAHKTMNNHMGGTPLTESILGSFPIAEAFLKRTKIDKLTYCLITDGDGSNAGYVSSTGRLPIHEVGYVKDGVTNRIYSVDRLARNGFPLLKMLKDRYDIHNIMGFYLGESQTMFKTRPSFVEYRNSGLLELNRKQTDDVYDKFFFINPRTIKFDTTAELKKALDRIPASQLLKNDTAVGDETTAFMQTRRAGMTFVNKVVDAIS